MAAPVWEKATSMCYCMAHKVGVLHAGRKRSAGQLQPERHHSEALRGGHRDVLRGDRWKLLRVQSLSALPSDADLLASLKGKKATDSLQHTFDLGSSKTCMA